MLYCHIHAGDRVKWRFYLLFAIVYYSFQTEQSCCFPSFTFLYLSTNLYLILYLPSFSVDLHFCIFCVLLANIHIFHDFIFPHLNWVTFFPIHDTVRRHSFWLLFYLECFRVNVRTRRCEKDLKLIPLEEFQTVQIWIKGSLKERKEMTETWCFLIIISYTKFRSECLVRRYWIRTSKQWLPIWWFRSGKNLKNLFFTLSFCANEKFYIYIVSISFIFVFSIEKFRFHIYIPDNIGPSNVLFNHLFNPFYWIYFTFLI